MSEQLKPEPESASDYQQMENAHRLPAEQQLGQVAAECFSRNKETLPDPYHYKILKYRDKESTNKLQRSYVRYTDKLIEKINRDEIDHTVFLDKSARPVAWMMNELWDSLATRDEKEVPEQPGISFLNIDREQWRDKVGGKEVGSGVIDTGEVDQSVIDSLRYMFVAGRKYDEEGNDVTTESVWDMPTVLDEKNVLIIDEVKFTGDSGRIAQKLLQRAIPEANIQEPHHWMVAKTAGKDMPDIPVWYSDKIKSGRWIDDRDRTKSQQSPSSIQKEGYMFLSTRQDKVDAKSQELRAECKALARDYKRGEYGIIK